MNDFLLSAHVVLKTWNLIISRCCFVDYGKKCTEMRAARAAQYFFLTNDILALWRCRC